jgi:23S rRNA (uracil1939-C5)-methyltransferase
MKRNKKNIILENIKLLNAGAKGVAIGKTEDGKTVLVTGAIPGDVVNARVKKSKSKYYEAEAVDILEESLQNGTEMYSLWSLWRLQMAEYEL